MAHRVKHGLCCYCGKEPLVGNRAGRKCLDKRAAQQRARHGHKPQEETGMGRPKLAAYKWNRTHYLRYDKGVTLNVMKVGDRLITKDGTSFPADGQNVFPAKSRQRP